LLDQLLLGTGDRLLENQLICGVHPLVLVETNVVTYYVIADESAPMMPLLRIPGTLAAARLLVAGGIDTVLVALESAESPSAR
jgi:hypothetical protein